MSNIDTNIDGHILHIHLNRPEARNAFNKAMAIEMAAILDQFEENTDLRVAVLTAEGRTFSAGQDLKDAAKGELATTDDRGGFGIMSKPPMKPLIAAVEGQALAGGMELTLCCDMIVASRESVFGLAEVKRSLVAVGGGCFRLPRRVPYQIAMEMILTGEPLPAEEMHRFGYVNRVVEPGNAKDTAFQIAHAIAQNAPLAVQASKTIAYRSISENWTDATGFKEQWPIAMVPFGSGDQKEGLAAFAEKRPAKWQGK